MADDSPAGIDQAHSDQPGTTSTENTRSSRTDGGGAPPEGAWAATGRTLRWLIGAGSLVSGLTWILVTQLGPVGWIDIATGLVLAAGGLVLLMPHRISLPRRATAPVMIGTALAGTFAGLAAGTSRLCCMFASVTDRGWPYAWAQRGAVADDPETAIRLARSADWSVDVVALTADLVLWAYVGMLVLVVVVLVGRARRH
ncbi:MAG: hypothetical protein ABW046_18055 [Actinoplanes sp.]